VEPAIDRTTGEPLYATPRGHKTHSLFDRCNLEFANDVAAAGRRLTALGGLGEQLGDEGQASILYQCIY
jgi:hypothetical protein